ncbi:MAG TPA: copper-containing nitrite reductase [Anaerolineales bacterium]|nr:copper-containing nitrite reductase [Anaerolineales bacterium]
MKISFKLFSLLMVVTVLISACASAAKTESNTTSASTGTGRTVEYSLMTAMTDGQMAFMGMGGGIDGIKNPTLSANVGDTVKIILTAGDSVEHDVAFPDFNAQSEHIAGQGTVSSFEFVADKPGTFKYNCLLAGHKEAGMVGTFVVTGSATDGQAPASASANGQVISSEPVVVSNPATKGADVVRDPTEIPAEIGVREPQTVRVDLEAVEVLGQLADGTTYKYWTFNGQVPGPFVRVRVGDTIEVHMKNMTNSSMAHSVDLHAVTGPGGGATMTQTKPGEETMFTAKALNPGLFVYHCATPMVAEHIANGMYGMILVEPEEGLPPVDREFYVMQGEVYTKEAFGSTGLLNEDTQAILNENPQYLVFNGAVGGLTEQKPLKANVGETVRIFFGVGGPNFTSSFHVIGEIFDRVYEQASLTSPVLTNIQTTSVPPGGATMVEFKVEVPGRYILVDHALARLQRGLAGFLMVEGPENHDIINGTTTAGSGH